MGTRPSVTTVPPLQLAFTSPPKYTQPIPSGVQTVRTSTGHHYEIVIGRPNLRLESSLRGGRGGESLHKVCTCAFNRTDAYAGQGTLLRLIRFVPNSPHDPSYQKPGKPLSDSKYCGEPAECYVRRRVGAKHPGNSLPGELLRCHCFVPLTDRNPLVNDLSESLEQRVRHQFEICRIVRDV